MKIYITAEKTKLKQMDDNYILYNLLPIIHIKYLIE